MAVAVLLLAAVAPAQTYRSGMMLEQAGQVDAAFNEYRLAARTYPDEPSAFNELARLSDQLKRYDTLLAVSRDLAKARPERRDYSLGLVSATLGMKRTADARGEARRFAAKWPQMVLRLADVFEKHNEFSEAIGYLRQVQKSDTNNPTLGDRLADLYDKAGQPAAAARELVAVINRRPQAVQGYASKLAAYAARAGSGVLAELDRIADPVARGRAKAAALLALRRDDEAIRVLRPVLTDQELYMFAHEAEAQGAPGAALAVYRSQKAHADAARVLRTLGRRPEALAELAMDNGVGAQVELGDLHREARNHAAAADAYSKAMARLPSDERAIFGLASVLLEQGKVALARTTARKLVRKTDRVLFLIARTFFYEGAFDSASVCVAEVVKQFPQSLLANDALELSVLSAAGEKAGELARLMLDYETGVDGTAQARALAQGTGVASEHASVLLSRFLRRAGRPKDALAALDDYLKRFPSGSLRGKARLEQAYVLRDDIRDEGLYRVTLERLVVEEPGSAWVPVARNLLAEASKQAASSPVH